MGRLSDSDLQSRRVYDWQVVCRMNAPPRYLFSAHRTAEDAQRGRNAIHTEAEARHALHYRAEYHLQTLVGQGEYSPCTILRIDAACAEYPFKEPAAWVVEEGESRMPWSPHFAHGLPVCNGTIWRPDGKVLLGHYLIHLAHLLNWDERLNDGYGGYSAAAIAWWRKNLNRPLAPDLQYPALPVDLLYGNVIVRNVGGFRPTSAIDGRSGSGGFRAVGT